MIASFWIGNIILLVLNVPLIGVWVKLLGAPYKYLYPSALFFICVGVYSTNNSFFDVGETLVIGIAGYFLLRLDFHPAPILMGFILGPCVEENLRGSMIISEGDFWTFVGRPISATVLGCCVLLIAAEVFVWYRRGKRDAVDQAPLEVGQSFS